MADNQVFISYAWEGDGEVVANEIESVLNHHRITLIRDKTHLGFKGLIREFMEKIGQGDAIVLVINDKYLKSKNCMFELLEVKKHGDFIKRVLPVVLSDANIYDSLGIIRYIRYWEEKIKELDDEAKSLTSIADTQSVYDDINLYTDIRGTFDHLAELLSNMNVLTLDLMRARQFSPLLEALSVSKASRSDPSEQDTKTPAPAKEGKVLYHIPSMMQVESWTRCTVRVAWEELLLLEDLKIPEKDRIIESIRIGEEMQVSLQESPVEGNFLIQSPSTSKQFVTEDDFTEWLFEVKPLKAGKFRLVLKVTLIQTVQGKERARDIVLERTVTTESFVPRALPRFDTAHESLGIKNRPDGRTTVFEITDTAFPSPTPGIPATPPPATTPRRPFVRYWPYAASSVVLLICATLVYRSLAPQKSGSEGPSEHTVSPPTSPGGNETLIASIELEGSAVSEEPIYVLMKASELNLLKDSLNIRILSTADTIGRNLGKIEFADYRQVKDSLAIRKHRKTGFRPAPMRVRQ